MEQVQITQKLTRNQLILVSYLGFFLVLYLCNVVTFALKSSMSDVVVRFPDNFSTFEPSNSYSTLLTTLPTTPAPGNREYDDLTL